MFDAYQKFRSLIRRPVFTTADPYRGDAARGIATPDNATDDGDDAEVPDVSHVAPPQHEPAPRDEAIELIERRLDVVAARADRLERARELLDPARLAEVPTREEVVAIDERAAAARRAADGLETAIAKLTDAHGRHVADASTDRAAIGDVAAAQRAHDERVRAMQVELAAAKETIETLGDALRTTRQEFADRDALRARELTRRLAGLYILALVGLLGALAAIVLYVFAPRG